MFIFILGAIALAVYGLLRGILCPVHNVRWVSRHYNVPDFVLTLTVDPGD